MFISDDERSLLSMRSMRASRPKSLWKRFGGLNALLMIMSGIMLGFIMGYDEASSRQSKQQLESLASDNKAVYHAHTTPLELLGHIRRTRKQVVDKITLEYGGWASTLLDKGSLTNVFQIEEGSISRYRRKLQQKLLRKLIDRRNHVKFRWVTAGDEAAAGLGLAPNQSYSDIVRDTATDAFNAVGIGLEVKNKALKGFGSAPALALCLTDFFGPKIDVLSWDFGATDLDNAYRTALWGARATLHPTKPLLMVIDSSNSRRWRQMSRVDGKLGVALLDTLSLADFADRHLPDSTHLTRPTDLPYAVRYLQCKGAIEGQNVCESEEKRGRCTDPRAEICYKNKFEASNNCETAKYQVDWIPGW